jgi:hypothetical protein
VNGLNLRNAPRTTTSPGLGGTATVTYVYTPALPVPASIVMAATSALMLLGYAWCRGKAKAAAHG